MVADVSEEISESIFRIKVKPKGPYLLTKPFFDNHGPEDVDSKVLRNLSHYLPIDLNFINMDTKIQNFA
jgi:hypothetical protein